MAGDEYARRHTAAHGSRQRPVEPPVLRQDVRVMARHGTISLVGVDKPELAESTDGEAIALIKQLSKEGDMAIAGSFMAAENGKAYNRGFFCCPDGTIQFADKRHLFIGDEQKYFSPGNKHLDIIYKGVKFRLLICFDLRFPVWARNKSGNDYDVLIYTANWPKSRIDAWDALTVARAIENQAYVAAVNAIGTDSYNVEHCGHSVIIDPRGKKLASLEDFESGVRSIDLDLEYLEHVRTRLPFSLSNDDFTIKL
mgnify:CR=1 FL=1